MVRVFDKSFFLLSFVLISAWSSLRLKIVTFSYRSKLFWHLIGLMVNKRSIRLFSVSGNLVHKHRHGLG